MSIIKNRIVISCVSTMTNHLHQSSCQVMWSPPVTKNRHPPTQLTKSWIGGCPYIPSDCKAAPAAPHFTSSFSHHTSSFSSALLHPHNWTHASHIPGTLQTRSPSDTQPSRNDMSYRAASFLLFILSRMLRYYRRSALPLGLFKNLLFILILPSILFRHFQKFSKLLHPLWFHLPSIQGFTIRLQPIQMVMLLNPMPWRIPLIRFNKRHHLIVTYQPAFFLCHMSHNYP